MKSFFEAFTSFLDAILKFLLIIGVVFFMSKLRNDIILYKPMLVKANIFGFEYKFDQIKLVNEKDDKTSESEDIARFEIPNSEKTPGWVYLGSYKNDKEGYKDLTFKMNGLEHLPKKNEKLISKIQLNKRYTEPQQINGQWTRGLIIGTLDAHKEVSVSKAVKIPAKKDGYYIWIYIE